MIKFHKVELSVSTVDELNKAMSQLPHEIGVVHVEFVPDTQPDPIPDPIPEPTPVYSIAEVRAALAKVRDAQGVDGMREILRRHGVEKLADLDEKHYAAVMQEAQDAC